MNENDNAKKYETTDLMQNTLIKAKLIFDISYVSHTKWTY